ncbi:MAG: methylmalonyl-CoA mutase [Alphaproteobacteria bacterium]|nr:methylmalonyl-CoA mutase [Alphaproteobacteria bacterium]
MTDELPLAADFPPATRDDWLKLVRAALKDRPFERLIARTYDGIPIEPLYGRAANAQPIVGRHGPWQVMARVDHPDPAVANAEALHELENGATGLTLVCAGSLNAGGFGIGGTAEALKRVLDGVYLDAGITVDFNVSPETRDIVRHFAALVKSQGIDASKVAMLGSINPIGGMAAAGSTDRPWHELAKPFAGFIGDLAGQGFRGPFAAADGRIVHNAGGSEAQELAFVIASATAYLRALEAGGFAPDAARSMIYFRLAADADQFLTVAKFRALRLLWARVEQACGLAPKPAYVSAETAWRTMSRRDPFVNMLRTTIAVFAAGIGGANAILALPFTAAIGLPDRFARCIARNTKLLLLEEAHIANVADPAAGAGGIEALTGELCRAAWTLFQEIESAGGIGSALESGLIQNKIAAVRAEHEAAVAHRKEILTGTSDYPLLSELPAKVLDVPPKPSVVPAGKIAFPALPRIRFAEPFERLRDASDAMLAKTGSRPRVFLANFGTLAEFTPRATFAKNLFEAGGIEATANDGFKSRDEMLAAFKTSGARLACLCSSDEIYEREGADAAKALAAAGAGHIYLAGRPKDPERYKSAGVQEFVYAGCDALKTLQTAHDILGTGVETKR